MFLDQRGDPGRHAVRDLGSGGSGDSIVVAGSIEMRALGEPWRREMLRDAANVTRSGHTRQRDKESQSRNRGRLAQSIRGHDGMPAREAGCACAPIGLVG